ncbi:MULTISPECIES: hypothetical protein [Variovorax]|uniref:hypothetical protein n=1 Tax=Variovorax TaxID=34072 RepID=UPI00285C2870|nr:hypothetical protein [Variovorax sp. 3319]MDR6890840.1 hypothetical protein [Variovorax sp. 3319]
MAIGLDGAPTVGIILYAETDDTEVALALNSKSNPIGVTEHCLQGALPADMKGNGSSARES